MANKVTRSSTLKIELLFVDEDTRTLQIKRPRSNITSTEIRDLNILIQEDNLLVGDKTGATFGKITKAYTVNEENFDLDIS